MTVDTVSLGDLVRDATNGCGRRRGDGDPTVVLRLADVTADGRVERTNLRRVGLSAKERAKYALAAGDLLVFRVNGSRDVTGRTVPYRGPPGWTYCDHFIRVRLDTTRAEPRYIARAFASSVVRPQVQARIVSTAGQNTISQRSLASLQVPLPPLAEQRRIADLLDRADAIRRKQREALALTDELLRSTFLDMFGDVLRRRSAYPFGTIRALTRMASGKSSKPVLDPAGAVPVFGGNGVNGRARRALYDAPVVVVGRVGQHCGVVHLTPGPAWVTDNAIVVEVTRSDVLHVEYLFHALREAPLGHHVRHLDLPFVNQGMLKDQPIPLPPLATQCRFADARRSILATRRRAEEAVSESDDLFHALVQRAFRGEL